MLKIYLKSLQCIKGTTGGGSDEPYILVTAVDLESSAVLPAFEVIRYGPFENVNEGDPTRYAQGINQSFWSLTNTAATLADPADVIFIVALMENDSGEAEASRGIVKGIVASSIAASLGFSRSDKVAKLVNDVNAALLVPTGVPDPDNAIGMPQELRFSLAELVKAETGQAVQRTMTFIGNGGRYNITFETVNPAIQQQGKLQWYKHNGWQNGSPAWENSGNAKTVGTKWHLFKNVLGTIGSVVYGILPNGELRWYRHTGSDTGAATWMENGNGKTVGSSWSNFKFVFASDDGGTWGTSGILYGIMPDGDLKWYKHLGWGSGGSDWATESGKKVGNGWQNFTSVFATSNGVIYGVKSNGDLLWYRHTGVQNGTTGWANGSGQKVGSGWQGFKQVFATRNGVIYGVQQNGDLLWYKHEGFEAGTSKWANGSGQKVGSGWQNFLSAFAISNGVIYAILPS